MTRQDEYPEQQYVYAMQHYLEALCYLPKKQIRLLSADADRYIITFVMEGTPESCERTITYTPDGAGDIDAWYIHLALEPLKKQEDGGYKGQGGDVIHVFYGNKNI